jgi:hypothetical protein
MDAAEQIGILKEKLRLRVPNADGVGCFLCKWTLGDLEQNGTLTKGYPEISSDGKPIFPIEGKAEHLILEGFLERKSKPTA